MTTVTFGRIPASSQASSELSTASLTVVSSALRGLSNPSRCRFFAKNSLTAISFCLRAIVSAVSRLGIDFLIGMMGLTAPWGEVAPLPGFLSTADLMNRLSPSKDAGFDGAFAWVTLIRGLLALADL